MIDFILCILVGVVLYSVVQVLIRKLTEKADEINSLGMIVYVTDELKDKSSLMPKTWIRKLSDLPKDIKS